MNGPANNQADLPDALVVRQHPLFRVWNVLITSLMVALCAGLIFGAVVWLIEPSRSTDWEIGEGRAALWVLLILCACGLPALLLGLQHTLSSHPFRVIRTEGIECWNYHRRVVVPWPRFPKLVESGRAFHLVDMPPGTSAFGTWRRRTLPIGSVALWDGTCATDAKDIVDAVHRLCPHRFDWPVGVEVHKI